MGSPKARTSRWRQVLRRLEKQHGRPEPAARRPPLEQLILGLLSDQTSERKAVQALRRLQTDFVDFNEVRVTRPNDLAAAIHMVADPQAKAKRILRVLHQLFLRNACVTLEFLTRLPLDQARGFLEQLDGVDARTVATVVLLSLGGSALPADAALVRIAKRIGLVGRAWHAEQVQQVLEDAIPADDKFAFYRLMVIHGETVCLVKTTRCEACSLRTLCESSGARPKKAAAAGRRTPQRSNTGRRRPSAARPTARTRTAGTESRPKTATHARRTPKPRRAKRKR